MNEIIFSCFTPYQLLTSMYYAYKIKGVKKTLIFKNFSDYKIDEKFYFKFFDNIYIIPYYDSDNKILKQVKKMYYSGYLFFLSNIYKYIKNKKNIILMIFSDQEATTNKIINCLNNDTNVIILVEEGLGIYTKKKYIRPLRTKIVDFLCGICTTEYIGDYEGISKVIAKDPNKVDERFQKNILLKETDCLHDYDFINQIELDIDDFDALTDTILFLGEPIKELNISEKEYTSLLNEILEKFGGKYKIIIKPHPREDISFYRKFNDLIVIDKFKWVPVELLVLKYGFNIVFSICSAASVNIAKLNSDIQIYLLYKIFNLNIFNNINFDFNDIKNIKVVNNVNDIYIDNNTTNKIFTTISINEDINYLLKLIS